MEAEHNSLVQSTPYSEKGLEGRTLTSQEYGELSSRSYSDLDARELIRKGMDAREVSTMLNNSTFRELGIEYTPEKERMTKYKAIKLVGEDMIGKGYQVCKGLTQLVFATPYLMDKVEDRERKDYSSGDLILSGVFSSLLGGAILIATNSQPNMEGVNTPTDYLIAATPLVINILVNLYRAIESKISSDVSETRDFD